MRIGVFGGTFDPPHLGHLILATEASSQLKLDRVLFVLTPFPPHKQDQAITPLKDRQAMLELAIDKNNDYSISRVDIERQPPHYSSDTLELLKSEFKQDELVFLLGGDSLRDLPGWHAPEKIIAACDLIGVMHRPDDQIDLEFLYGQLPGLKQKIVFINAPLLEISSSEIRQRVATGSPYRYYLPEKVYQYIQTHQVYK